MHEGGKEEQGGRVSRLRIGGDGPEVEVDLVWSKVPGGSAEGMRVCDEERAYMVVSGMARMRVGGEVVEANEWDILHVPPGVPHGFENASEEEELAYTRITDPDGVKP